jgi:hypothetical protein
MKIFIITPVSRVDNLLSIYQSLVAASLTPIQIEWYVIFDLAIAAHLHEWQDRIQANGTRDIKVHFFQSDRKNAVGGHYHRNVMLDRLGEKAEGNLAYYDTWVYQLDDDNILHPSLANFLFAHLHQILLVDVVLFDQIHSDGLLRLAAGRLEVGHIDTAMMICRLKAIGTLRYDPNDYCADGHFIKNICEQSKPLIYNQPLCYYNFLRNGQ